MRKIKKEIRTNILDEKEKFSYEVIKEKSRAIFDTLKKTDHYQNANNIMIYATFGKEVFTRPIIEDILSQGKRVFVPLSVPKTKQLIVSELLDFDNDLAPGHFGVPEPTEETTRPTDPKTLDLIIVPGVAFDREGYRVGYGAGYYDRFLTRISEKASTIALAFDMQLIDKVPTDEYDLAVEYIITETQFFKCENNE